MSRILIAWYFVATFSFTTSGVLFGGRIPIQVGPFVSRAECGAAERMVNDNSGKVIVPCWYGGP